MGQADYGRAKLDKTSAEENIIKTELRGRPILLINIF